MPFVCSVGLCFNFFVEVGTIRLKKRPVEEVVDNIWNPPYLQQTNKNERVNEEKEDSEEKEEKLWTTVTLCWLFRDPLVQPLKQCMEVVYHRHILPDIRAWECSRKVRTPIGNGGINNEKPLTCVLPVQRLLSFLFFECPLPIASVLSVSLRFNDMMGGEKKVVEEEGDNLMEEKKEFGIQQESPLSILFSFPGMEELPVCDLSMGTVLAMLGPRLMMDVFCCVLMECRIVFHSADVSKLHTVCEVFRALIYPLRWTHVYLPVLPLHLLHLLEAPVPYMVGTHSDWIEFIHGDYLLDVILVDCDQASIEYHAVRQTLRLPEKEDRWLHACLVYLYRSLVLPASLIGDDYLSNALVDPHLKLQSGDHHHHSDNTSENTISVDRKIQYLFYDLLFHFLRYISECLYYLSPQCPVFNRSLFLADYTPAAYQEMLGLLTATNSFHELTESLHSPPLKFFLDCIEFFAELERKVILGKGEETSNTSKTPSPPPLGNSSPILSRSISRHDSATNLNGLGSTGGGGGSGKPIKTLTRNVSMASIIFDKIAFNSAPFSSFASPPASNNTTEGVGVGRRTADETSLSITSPSGEDQRAFRPSPLKIPPVVARAGTPVTPGRRHVSPPPNSPSSIIRRPQSSKPINRSVSFVGSWGSVANNLSTCLSEEEDSAVSNPGPENEKDALAAPAPVVNMQALKNALAVVNRDDWLALLFPAWVFNTQGHSDLSLCPRQLRLPLMVADRVKLYQQVVASIASAANTPVHKDNLPSSSASSPPRTPSKGSATEQPQADDNKSCTCIDHSHYQLVIDWDEMTSPSCRQTEKKEKAKSLLSCFSAVEEEENDGKEDDEGVVNTAILSSALDCDGSHHSLDKEEGRQLRSEEVKRDVSSCEKGSNMQQEVEKEGNEEEGDSGQSLIRFPSASRKLFSVKSRECMLDDLAKRLGLASAQPLVDILTKQQLRSGVLTKASTTTATPSDTFQKITRSLAAAQQQHEEQAEEVEGCLLNFLQIIMTAESNHPSTEELLHGKVRQALEKRNNRSGLVHILRSAKKDPSKQSQNTTSSVNVYPLHNAAFEAFLALFYVFLSICATQRDYSNAYALLEAGGQYFRLLPFQENLGEEGADDCMEFLSERTSVHPIYQTTALWKDVLIDRVPLPDGSSPPTPTHAATSGSRGTKGQGGITPTKTGSNATGGSSNNNKQFNLVDLRNEVQAVLFVMRSLSVNSSRAIDFLREVTTDYHLSIDEYYKLQYFVGTLWTNENDSSALAAPPLSTPAPPPPFASYSSHGTGAIGQDLSHHGGLTSLLPEEQGGSSAALTAHKKMPRERRGSATPSIQDLLASQGHHRDRRFLSSRSRDMGDAAAEVSHVSSWRSTTDPPPPATTVNGGGETTSSRSMHRLSHSNSFYSSSRRIMSLSMNKSFMDPVGGGMGGEEGDGRVAGGRLGDDDEEVVTLQGWDEQALNAIFALPPRTPSPVPRVPSPVPVSTATPTTNPPAAATAAVVPPLADNSVSATSTTTTTTTPGALGPRAMLINTSAIANSQSESTSLRCSSPVHLTNLVDLDGFSASEVVAAEGWLVFGGRDGSMQLTQPSMSSVPIARLKHGSASSSEERYDGITTLATVTPPGGGEVIVFSGCSQGIVKAWSLPIAEEGPQTSTKLRHKQAIVTVKGHGAPITTLASASTSVGQGSGWLLASGDSRGDLIVTRGDETTHQSMLLGANLRQFYAANPALRSGMGEERREGCLGPAITSLSFVSTSHAASNTVAAPIVAHSLASLGSHPLRSAPPSSTSSCVNAMDSWWLAVGTAGGGLGVMDLHTGSPIFLVDGHGAAVTKILAIKAHEFLSVGNDRSIKIWDVRQRPKATGNVVAYDERVLGNIGNGGMGSVGGLRCASGPITDVALGGQDHSLVISASADGIVRLWDLRYDLHTPCSQIRAHKHRISRLVWSEAHSVFHTASHDGTVRCWDSLHGTALSVWPVYESEGVERMSVMDIAGPPSPPPQAAVAEEGGSADRRLAEDKRTRRQKQRRTCWATISWSGRARVFTSASEEEA
eukprot:scaffold3243_cov173-Ochromonas_danica.AAC.2